MDPRDVDDLVLPKPSGKVRWGDAEGKRVFAPTVYDKESDVLFVWFVDTPIPAYDDPIDDYGAFRIDMQNGDVVGITVERFIARAIEKETKYLLLARIAGIKDRKIKRLERRMEKEMPPPEREAVLHDVVREFASPSWPMAATFA